jgi:curved DNA-binding protein CbpA
MDPYRVLGVPRSCTRAEVKEAFRARAWDAHPDRGGAEEDFIRLSTAYNQIIAELAADSGPRAAESEGAAWNGRQPEPTRGAQDQLHRGRRRRLGRKSRFPRPPDPGWEPDLVIAPEVPRGGRRPRPFDPNWVPDLIVLDDGPWDPDAGGPADPRVGTAGAGARLSRFFRSAAREDSFWQSEPARLLGMVLFLGLIAALLGLCAVVWNQDP